MRNKIALAVILSVFCLSAYSQLSQGGLPPSFQHPSNLRSVAASNHLVPVDLDIERFKWEDEMAEKDGTALRVAHNLPVDVNIANTGFWTTLADSSKIWRQSVTAKDAKGLIIQYSEFYIPRGAKLFIYNSDQSQVLGAYTNETNPEGGRFATEVIAGESFTLEYVASNISSEEPRIAINAVGYMYRDLRANGKDKPIINNTYELPTGGTSTKNCRINVNCPDGNNWKKQKKGVVLYFILIGNDWNACTGSLVNNTKQDGTPYVLSANHCFVGDPHFNSVITYFNFEFSGCDNETVAPKYQTLVGVTPLMQIPLTRGSDQFLVKLKNDIPEEFEPYFNGWDIRDVAPKSGVVIHHPRTDVKKIVTYDMAAKSGTFTGGASNAYWTVQYDGNSVTERGSSGAPLFNQEGLIVGTLTGGGSFCGEYSNRLDFYGKLNFGWDKFTEDLPYEQQLMGFLDPLNQKTQVLQGLDLYGTSGIEEDIADYSVKDLVIFPNPVENELNVNTNSIIRNIRVFSLQGRQVYSQEGNNSSTATIEISNLPKGVYSISVETESKKLTDKFIKR